MNQYIHSVTIRFCFCTIQNMLSYSLRKWQNFTLQCVCSMQLSSLTVNLMQRKPSSLMEVCVDQKRPGKCRKLFMLEQYISVSHSRSLSVSSHVNTVTVNNCIVWSRVSCINCFEFMMFYCFESRPVSPVLQQTHSLFRLFKINFYCFESRPVSPVLQQTVLC